MELPETALAGALPAGVLPADDPLAGDPAFAELSVAECYRLLDTHQIGRVAWASRRGQLILPVATSCATAPSCSGPLPPPFSPS